MGCCSSKPDSQSEGPINEPCSQLSEPHYDNAQQGNHSPPTPAPNEPAPHEIGVAVTTPDNTAGQQPDGNYQTGGTQPQGPVMLPESTAEGEGRQEDPRSRSSSSSSSSSSSNRDAVRSDEGNRGY